MMITLKDKKHLKTCHHCKTCKHPAHKKKFGKPLKVDKMVGVFDEFSVSKNQPYPRSVTPSRFG